MSAERYLKTFPALKADAEAALVVIYGEFFLRKELGEAPSLLEYVARFPQHARRLRDQVMWHEAIEWARRRTPARPAIPGLEVGELLGRGGMCSVYQAVETATGATVAVKVLDAGPPAPAAAGGPVRPRGRVADPPVATRTSSGPSGPGRPAAGPFLVMEFCPGGTLQRPHGRPAAPRRPSPRPSSRPWPGRSSTPTARGSSTAT